MMADNKGLILVVEDEPFIAMDIEDTLMRHSYAVIGPVGDLTEALGLARSELFLTGGLLDIHIRGGDVYPAAEVLLERNIPFVFTTGYSVKTIPKLFQDVPVLSKPWNSLKLMEIMIQHCGSSLLTLPRN